MYIEVSEALKNAVKSNVITTKARLTFKNFFSDSSDLIIENDISSEGLNLVDCCYDEENGKLIGTAALKEVEIEINNKEGYDLADKEFDLDVAVLIDRQNLTYEYIPYGRYVVVSYEDLKSSNKYKIIADDLMVKLNPKFKENEVFNPTYPISAKEYYRQFMASYGIEIEEQELINADFVIKTALEFEENTGRYVLGRLAELFGSFAKINRKNKCQMYLKTETDEVMELSQMNTTLEIDKRYGPVNVVTIGMSQVEGENVTLKDKNSITANGETTIRIDDNPFLYTEELREKAITPLFERLKGFTYIPVNFKHKALLYTDCGDMIQVRNMQNGELVDTIILNQYINIPRTRQSSIESPALTNVEQKYKYISNTKQAQTQTEIKVDKYAKQIESVVAENTEQNEKINRVVQTVDELNSKISDIADITISAEKNIARVELEDINISEPIRVVVHPIVDNIAILYPSLSTFPSSGTYLRTRTLRFENTETNEIIDFEIPDNLYYYDEENYDEFILDYDSQTCLINKRIGVNEDGSLYLLENQITTEYEYPIIPLNNGDYIISLVGYDVGYLFVRLMVQNIYTTQFATKAELNSEINQTTREIELSVNQKLALYPTTQEMTAAIEISAGNITQQVSEKVGEDEVIAKLNLAVQDKQGIINLTGNTVTIDSDYFKLDKNGTIRATEGYIAGMMMTRNSDNDTFLAKTYTGTDGLRYQSGLYVPDITNGGTAFLYAGVPMTGYLSNANTMITHDGLIKAKWIEMNGESGYTKICFDSGNTAMELGSNHLTFKIDNAKNAVFAYFEREQNSFSLILHDAPNFSIIDELHDYRRLYRIDTRAGTIPYHYFLGEAWIDRELDGTYAQVAVSGDWSDKRLKKDIKDSTESALDRIDKMKFKQFTWNETAEKAGTHVDIGVIAQDLQEIDENYVETTTRIYKGEKQELLSINLLNLLTTTTKAVQEAKEKIEKRDKIIEFLAEKLNCKDEVLKMLKEGE